MPHWQTLCLLLSSLTSITANCTEAEKFRWAILDLPEEAWNNTQTNYWNLNSTVESYASSIMKLQPKFYLDRITFGYLHIALNNPSQNWFLRQSLCSVADVDNLHALNDSTLIIYRLSQCHTKCKLFSFKNLNVNRPIDSFIKVCSVKDDKMSLHHWLRAIILVSFSIVRLSWV